MKINLQCVINPLRIKATLIPLKLQATLEKVFPIEVYEYIFMNIELHWATLDW